jgi:hypothetical protein
MRESGKRDSLVGGSARRRGVALHQVSGLVWSGLVWSGLVWSGLVWSGLVWSGLVHDSRNPIPCLPLPASRFPVPASRFPIPDYRKKDSIVLAIGQFLFLALRCDLSAFTPIRLLVFNFFSKRDSERFDVLLNSEKGIGNFASI